MLNPIIAWGRLFGFSRGPPDDQHCSPIVSNYRFQRLLGFFAIVQQSAWVLFSSTFSFCSNPANQQWGNHPSSLLSAVQHRCIIYAVSCCFTGSDRMWENAEVHPASTGTSAVARGIYQQLIRDVADVSALLHHCTRSTLQRIINSCLHAIRLSSDGR